MKIIKYKSLSPNSPYSRLHKSVDEIEYLNHSELIFSRGTQWQVLLGTQEIVSQYSERDIYSTPLDLPNQRVLLNDCKRTRAMFFDQELCHSLHVFLTYYVKRENIRYKQGLNEIAAPFMIFKQAGYSLDRILLTFSKFIDTLLPNIYQDDEFMSLMGSLHFYGLLLRFHDAELFTFLMSHDISPQLYTTPWFITLMVSKCSFEVAQTFIEFLAHQHDPTFIFYVAVAVCISNRKGLLQCDEAMIPQNLTSIRIDDESTLQMILGIAFKLKQSTPVSFEIKIHQTNMFQKNYHHDPILREQMQMKLDEVEKQTFIRVQPFEIFYNLQSYPQRLKCQNVNCYLNNNAFSSSLLFQECLHFQTFQQFKMSRNLQQLLTLSEQSKSSSHQNKCNLNIPIYQKDKTLVYLLNFSDGEVVNKHPNIIVVDVAKLNKNSIDQHLEILQESTFYINLVFWNKVHFKPDLEEKSRQFIDTLLSNNIRYVSVAEQGFEEYLPQCQLTMVEETKSQEIQKNHKDKTPKISPVKQSNKLFDAQNQVDQSLVLINISMGQSIKSGDSFLNLDCNITVGSKVFYESSLYYDRENLIIMKQNKLILSIKHEQPIEQKKMKILFLARMNEVFSMKQGKNQKSLILNMVISLQKNSRLRSILEANQLLNRSVYLQSYYYNQKRTYDQLKRVYTINIDFKSVEVLQEFQQKFQDFLKLLPSLF